MGCDIHLFLERQVKPGVWAMVFNYNGLNTAGVSCIGGQDLDGYLWFKVRNRNYHLFGEIAGVRGDSSLGYEPKGLPPDVSPMVQYRADEWDGDGHSHSWLSAREFIKLYAESNRNQELLDDIARNDWSRSPAMWFSLDVKDPHYDPKGEDIDNLRFVFWFDN